MDKVASAELFPKGIKLCYNQNDKIIPIKNYIAFFTSEKAGRFFGATYYFFIKKNNINFEKEQDNSPIQSEIKDLEKKLESNLSKDEIEAIIQRLDLLNNLSNKGDVYIPYCACLVSKYPLIEPMEKCLESIVNVLCDENSNITDLNEYISNIVDSIPYPPNNTSIIFPLSNDLGNIEIKPCYLKDLNLSFEPSFLLTCMRKRNILLLFKMLLFEKIILIIGKDMAKISKVIQTFLTLLYPFEWGHTYLSNMNENTFIYLRIFLPAIFGMRIDIFDKNKNNLEISENVFIFNLDDNKFDISDNLGKKKKEHIKVSNNSLPKLPRNLENDFKKELEKIQKELNKKKDKESILNADLKMRNLFMQVFAEILFGYEKCTYLFNKRVVFNKFTFMQNINENDRGFYNDLINVENFIMFLQKYQLNPNEKYYFRKDYQILKTLKKIINPLRKI